MPAPLAAQLRVDPRRAVPALRPLVLGPDPRSELRVLAVPVTGLPVPGGVVGGTGDLQQLARMPDCLGGCLIGYLGLNWRVTIGNGGWCDQKPGGLERTPGQA